MVHSTIVPPAIDAVLIDTPFFQNGLLKANITWTFNLCKYGVVCSAGSYD